MSFLPTLSALATVTYLLFGAVALARNSNATLNRVFFVYCMLGAYGAGVQLLYRTAESAARAQAWIDRGFLWVFFVAALFHFVLVYTERGASLRRGWGYVALYGPATALFALFHLTDRIRLRPVPMPWGWTYDLEAEPLEALLLAAWPSALALLGLYFCLEHVLAQGPRRRAIAVYVLSGVAVPGFLGFLSEGVFRVFGVRLPELTALGGIITCVLLGYAMWKHELFAVTAASAAEGILSTMSDLVFVLGTDMRIAVANAAAARALGYSERDLVGQLMERFIAMDNPSRTVHRGVADPSFDVHVVIVGKDSRRIPVSLSTSLVTDEEKRIRGSVVVCRDISARVEAQEALAESEERFRLLVERSPNLAVQGIDAERRVFFWNMASERLYGFSRDEAEGRLLEELIVPAGEREAAVAQVRRWLVQREALPAGEAVRVTKSGAAVPVFSSHVKLMNVRGATELYNLDLDLSERKRLEGQLLHAQKMESIGRLAGGIAHDFNNLITIILGNADLAAAAAPPDSESAKNLREIVTAAEHAADLTRRLLAFSRRQPAQPRVVDLNAEACDLESMLRRLVAESITIRLELAADLWPATIDPSQVAQLLSNMVVNAVDAMPDGGTITVATANVSLDVKFSEEHPGAFPGDYAQVSVVDTGVGMDEETLARVFEPFFTTKERGKGTGLGLATCYGIVKQNAGYIWVTSARGQGARFDIYLPRSARTGAAAGLASPAASAPTDRGHETVLLVEDAAPLREMMATALRERGYAVVVASDGEDALQTLAAHPPAGVDLLITDVVMPHMGGKELCARLRQQYAGCRVLFVSGYTDDSIAPPGISEPGVALLEKPFTSAALVQRAREVLDGAPTNEGSAAT